MLSFCATTLPTRIKGESESEFFACSTRKESRMAMKTEGFIRFAAMLLAIAAAAIVGTDEQTKKIFFMDRTATPKDLNALEVVVIVYSIAGVYNLLQLCKLFFCCWCKGTQGDSSKILAWVCFSSDQVIAYVTFAATTAASQASLLAITGQNEFQWLKLCDKYGRFCRQIGGGLGCGLLAAFLLALLSSISAFALFKRNSSNHLLLKEVTK